MHPLKVTYRVYLTKEERVAIWSMRGIILSIASNNTTIIPVDIENFYATRYLPFLLKGELDAVIDSKSGQPILVQRTEKHTIQSLSFPSGKIFHLKYPTRL